MVVVLLVMGGRGVGHETRELVRKVHRPIVACRTIGPAYGGEFSKGVGDGEVGGRGDEEVGGVEGGGGVGGVGGGV